LAEKRKANYFAGINRWKTNDFSISNLGCKISRNALTLNISGKNNFTGIFPSPFHSLIHYRLMYFCSLVRHFPAYSPSTRLSMMAPSWQLVCGM
jgi:hypothetical protein